MQPVVLLISSYILHAFILTTLDKLTFSLLNINFHNQHKGEELQIVLTLQPFVQCPFKVTMPTFTTAAFFNSIHPPAYLCPFGHSVLPCCSLLPPSLAGLYHLHPPASDAACPAKATTRSTSSAAEGQSAEDSGGGCGMQDS